MHRTLRVALEQKFAALRILSEMWRILTFEDMLIYIDIGRKEERLGSCLLPVSDARSMVEALQPLGTPGNGKQRNRRVSFFEESSDFAPGQLYSTESGRYRLLISLYLKP
jgi:hypothetical protein